MLVAARSSVSRYLDFAIAAHGVPRGKQSFHARSTRTTVAIISRARSISSVRLTCSPSPSRAAPARDGRGRINTTHSPPSFECHRGPAPERGTGRATFRGTARPPAGGGPTRSDHALVELFLFQFALRYERTTFWTLYVCSLRKPHFFFC